MVTGSIDTIRAEVEKALIEFQASERHTKATLRAQLAKLEAQEERLIDLAAEGNITSSKLQDRLSYITLQKGAITEKLAQTEDRLRYGAEKVLAYTDLLAEPRTLYASVPDNVKRALLGAFFKKLTVHVDDDGIHIDAERTDVNATLHDWQTQHALASAEHTPQKTKQASRKHAEGLASITPERSSSSKGLNILDMVGILSLCSTKSETGVTTDGLRQILAAAGTERPQPRERATKRKWVRLPEATKQTIAQRYAAGETSVALAAEYGIAKSTVLNLLRDQNVVVRRQPMTPGQVAEAQSLYEAGQPLSRLSAQMAIPQDTIRLALKAAGVQLRPATGR